MKYIHRSIEKLIKSAVSNFPAVVLTGPRQTGKSTLLNHLFKEYSSITFDNPNTLTIAKKDPEIFIENLKLPVVFDEVQYVCEIIPYIKIIIDKNPGKNGLFILTGSQIFPLMKGVSESLAGRAALFELLPLSFEELNNYPDTPKKVFDRIIKGFYPRIEINKRININLFYSSYTSTYLEKDLRHMRSIEDMSVFYNFIRVLATRVGSLLNLNQVASDCGITYITARQWFSLLESARIIYLLRPFSGNISKRFIKSPKLYFTDTGLLSYLLGFKDANTLISSPIAGSIFENLIIIEVLKKKFNENINMQMFFYRDSNGNEADLILDFGSYKKVIEIKSTKTLNNKLLNYSKRIGIKDADFYLLYLGKDKFATNNLKILPWYELKNIIK
jgi:predicted AAA+ superfamily ATPase